MKSFSTYVFLGLDRAEAAPGGETAGNLCTEAAAMRMAAEHLEQRARSLPAINGLIAQIGPAHPQLGAAK